MTTAPTEDVPSLSCLACWARDCMKDVPEPFLRAEGVAQAWLLGCADGMRAATARQRAGGEGTVVGALPLCPEHARDLAEIVREMTARLEALEREEERSS
jgi:hypothetical protein